MILNASTAYYSLLPKALMRPTTWPRFFILGIMPYAQESSSTCAHLMRGEIPSGYPLITGAAALSLLRIAA
jgi:hypothetical protein